MSAHCDLYINIKCDKKGHVGIHDLLKIKTPITEIKSKYEYTIVQEYLILHFIVQMFNFIGNIPFINEYVAELLEIDRTKKTALVYDFLLIQSPFIETLNIISNQ